MKDSKTLSIARHADMGKLAKWQQKDELSKKNGPHAAVYMTNGDRYIGSWKDNLKHGSGTYYYHKTESIYQGEWAFDMRNGYGTLSIKQEAIEQGSESDVFRKLLNPSQQDSVFAADNKKKKSLQSIHGTPLPTKLRKVYAGEWSNDKRGGRGIYFYQDGSTYDGMWDNDMREGWGRMAYADGSIYEGEWHKEKRHGQGVLLSKNGDRYEGMWMNDMKEGPGRFVYKQKRQCYKGEWAQDVPRFGTLIDLPPLPGKPDKRFLLPALGLINPEGILSEQHMLLVEERLSRVLQEEQQA